MVRVRIRGLVWWHCYWYNRKIFQLTAGEQPPNIPYIVSVVFVLTGNRELMVAKALLTTVALTFV